MAITSMGAYSGQHGMLVRNESSSDSFVAMLGSCSHRVGLQAPRPIGGLEDAVMQGGGQKRPFYAICDGPTVEDGSEDVDEGADDCSPGGAHMEKKRRLTFDQVRSLERNFEIENKLEPERKMQLAKDLGLRPRQVAVWFQNRRARWKTKQLERDYETLASDYKRLKADYELVLGEKNGLKAELQRLSGEAQGVDKVEVHNLVEPALPSNQTNPQSSEADRIISNFAAKNGRSRSIPTVDISLACPKDKEETSGSTNDTSSDVLDAESPRTTDSSCLSARSDEDQLIQCPGFPPESFVDPDMLRVCDEDIRNVPVKLEGGSSDFHDDQSCNYLLMQLDDQTVLPWWDWA